LLKNKRFFAFCVPRIIFISNFAPEIFIFYLILNSTMKKTTIIAIAAIVMGGVVYSCSPKKPAQQIEITDGADAVAVDSAEISAEEIAPAATETKAAPEKKAAVKKVDNSAAEAAAKAAAEEKAAAEAAALKAAEEKAAAEAAEAAAAKAAEEKAAAEATTKKVSKGTGEIDPAKKAKGTGK
jgi:hypothetical protein